MPGYRPEVLMPLIVSLLAPMFLAASGGDGGLARQAALAAVDAYGARSHAELIASAQIVAFGLAALESLGRAMRGDVSPGMALRLRGNANALNRSAEQNRRAVREGRLDLVTEHARETTQSDPSVAEHSRDSEIPRAKFRNSRTLNGDARNGDPQLGDPPDGDPQVGAALTGDLAVDDAPNGDAPNGAALTGDLAIDGALNGSALNGDPEFGDPPDGDPQIGAALTGDLAIDGALNGGAQISAAWNGLSRNAVAHIVGSPHAGLGTAAPVNDRRQVTASPEPSGTQRASDTGSPERLAAGRPDRTASILAAPSGVQRQAGQRPALWAAAMVEVAGRITADLPSLAPAARKAAAMRATALSSSASLLLR
ncbi:MAG TPA: hypothetical protein VGC09_15875 [Rhodopila sp.]